MVQRNQRASYTESRPLVQNFIHLKIYYISKNMD